MKVVTLDIKAIRKGEVILRKPATISLTETTTVADVKANVQNELKFNFEKEKEEFFYMSKELKDTDIVPYMSGNEYIIRYK